MVNYTNGKKSMRIEKVYDCEKFKYTNKEKYANDIKYAKNKTYGIRM